MKYTPRQPETNVNVTPTSQVREFFILTGGLLTMVVGIYFLLGLAVNLVAPRLPVGFEKKLGNMMMSKFDQQTEFKQQEDYLQSLADTLQKQCARLPYDFKLHLQSAPQFNAMALPGGHIVVFSGLFDAAGAENELAFVLAHEMGHYAHRDHLKAMGRGLVFIAISTALFGADSGVSHMLSSGLSLAELSFSRTQETRADEFALAALDCTYGHISGAVEFMQKFPKEADPGKVGHYFSSHPEVERRIAHLEGIIKSEHLHTGKLKPLPEAVSASGTDHR